MVSFRLIVALVLLLLAANCDCRRRGRRNRQHCNNDAPLENRRASAPVIFTGTVEKVYRRRRSLVYRGSIRVRRIIKGSSDLFANQSVIINGFGNPLICKSDVRPRDTRIFLLAPSDYGHLELNSSLARVTLRNLRKSGVSEYGKSSGKSNLYRYSLFPNSSIPQAKPYSSLDVPAKKKSLLDESPCDKKLCAFGSICLVDEVTKAPFCRCDMTCNNVFAPLCGTDDVTYTNECKVSRASCKQQKYIHVKFIGQCNSSDPCANKKCPFHSTCVVQMDGITPECLCPEKCARYGDNRGSQSVCGTDGVDYPLVCELKRAACTQMKDIQIKYRGRCDPCEGVECPANQVCQLEKNRKHVCRCNGLCNEEHDPVCGSDGKTYSNECFMRVEACRSRKTIRMIYKGECSSRTNPCNSLQCYPGEECNIDRQGIARCICPDTCEPVMKPVCGTDDKTYDNECELKRKACIRRVTIDIKYHGICSESGPCSSFKCDYEAMCVETKGIPRCECPTCSAEFKPVCGTNGITYNNNCKLKRESCEKKKQIKMAYEGLCNGCEKKKCEFYSLCESDGNGNAVCICPDQCINVNSTVCGSDGMTYVNECEMKVNACKLQRNVFVESRGACDLCKDVHCKFGAKCENGNCVCPMDCPDNYDPLCGSNGITYTNECHLKRTECQMGSELIVASYGECEDLASSGNGSSQLQPCGGLEPLHDELTGKDIYCGDGVGGTSCPTDSYCHKSPYGLFAKCCKQAMTIRSCGDSQYGCCPDMKTPALGVNNAGCPSVCMCNEIGSEDKTCDPITRQCSCKPGVGGLRCDRCEPGFWGLPMVAEGNSGCIPCGCSLLGSIRDDCDQMTGRCMCKAGIEDMKCKECPPNQILTPSGCQDADLSVAAAKDCSELRCYFGARCVENDYDKRPSCVCDIECTSDKSDQRPVCGSDGQTYGSECQLKQFSCRYQNDIVVSALGPCRGRLNPTKRPTTKRRGSRRRQSGSSSRWRNKSTRHIQLDDKNAGSFNSSFNKYPNNDASKRPLNSTVLFKGIIGSICVDNNDCFVRHSHCRRHKCRCKPPSRPNKFLLQCHRPKIQRQCSAALCNNKGSCTNLSKGAIKCKCHKGFTGSSCNVTESQVETPAFFGDSHMQFRRIRGYKQLIVKLTFKSFALDGAILYNGQNIDGNGDFLSLALKDGFVEFRYDLGNGPVIIKSLQKIELNKQHQILIKRYLQDGVLELDGITKRGRSRGTLKGLNLRTDLYLGGIPSNNKKIEEKVGVSIGFVGCISKMKIGRKLINLNYPNSNDIKTASNIGECKDSPCQSLACQNGATCFGSIKQSYRCNCIPGFTGHRCDKKIDECSSNPCAPGASCMAMPDSGGYLCSCPIGRTGKHCESLVEELHEAFIPDFQGQSHLQLPRLRRIGRAFKIELWLYVRSPNGMVLYNGQHSNGQGDYISLNLINGHLNFKFNLGSGECNITSPRPISMNKWHIVKIQRKHRKGMLQLDDNPVISGQSAGSLTQLNVRQPLFLGGFRGKINPESRITGGLDGAIQKLIVNDDAYGDLVMRSHRTHLVSRFFGAPCYTGTKNPCLNGGICVPNLNQFSCKCPLKHMGKFCEKLMSDQNTRGKPVKFDGNTELKIFTNFTKSSSKSRLTTRRHRGQKTNKFQISLKTNEPQGLIVWMNRGATIKGDFLAISVNNGYLELSYNLGKQTDVFVIKSRQRIDDNKWHNIKINRRKRLGMLQIDGGTQISNVSSIGATQLNTHGYLWLGGAPSIPLGLPSAYSKGFKGCIGKIEVDENELNLSADSRVKFCSS